MFNNFQEDLGIVIAQKDLPLRVAGLDERLATSAPR